MYKVGIVLENGNRFLNGKAFFDKISAKGFQKQCEKALGDLKFETVAYCDCCEVEQKKLYAGGLCASCFKRLENQSPCYGCEENVENGACANCWVTRYIIGGARN